MGSPSVVGSIVSPTMESLLQVRLFGGLALRWGEAALSPITGLSARSLFAYLITYRHLAHTRDLLAGTFWPDLPDAQARRRLSHALWQIGHVLNPLPSPVSYLLTEADSVQFNTEAPYWLDTEEFQVACSGFQAALPANPEPEIGNLKRAVSLYRGDFLAGFYDDWAVLERERLREMYLTALSRLVECCKVQGGYEEALGYARRLVAEDPLHEEGHREVMRLCYVLGRRNEALQQYEVCRTVLAEELGIEPGAASTALYREIAACGEVEAPHLPLVPGPPPSPLLEGTGQVSLVGREGERTALVGHLEEAIGGHGGLVLVEGEAGVGKTRLLQEVARDAEWRGAQVLWGHGREIARLPPYSVLSEALRTGLSPLRAEQLVQLVEGIWLREASLLLPELAEWLPDLPPHVALEPQQERRRLLEALTRLVLALGQIAPHLVTLEDLQWADEATLEALAYLARHLAASRVLVIGSYRSEEARERATVWEALQTLDRAGGHERLELSRLTAEETGELVRRGLGLRGKAPRFEARLYRETEGNPLFVLEMLQALHDEGLLYRDASGDWSTPWDETTVDYAELPLPAEVYQVIGRRLARLGPHERAMLNTAAVLGADFDFALLMRAGNLGSDVSLAAVRELVRRRLLEEGATTYRFSHDKVRLVTYTEMPEAERRQLHRQAGEALEPLHPERVEALAYHFTQGQVQDKAMAYSLEAAERAQAVYAYEEALEHHERALNLADGEDLATRWEIHRRRAEVLDILGRREEQRATLMEMMRLAVALGDEVRQATALFCQGCLKVRTGAPCEGAALLQEGADIARRREDYSLAGKCYVMLSRAYWHQGQVSRCLAAIKEAQALFRWAGDRGGETDTLYAMGNLYLGLLGHYEQALHCFEQMGEIAQELNRVEQENTALMDAGIALMSLGRYRESQDFLSRAESFSMRVGYKLQQAVIAFGQANNYLGLGDYEAARSAAQRGLALCREIGNRNFEIENLMVLGRIALQQGLYHQARAYFEESVAVAQAGEQTLDLAWQQSYLALTLLFLGEKEVARRLSAEALSVVEQEGPNVAFLELVYFHHYQILLQLEGIEAAERYLERAYQALMARANAIHDLDLRRCFLEQVPENPEIIAAYEAWQSGTQQVRLYLPRADAPTGRPLRDDEYVEVTWTVVAPEDEAIRKRVDRRRHRLLRLLEEAHTQGAAPAYTHLAGALRVGLRTIERDMAALRQTHPDLPLTRGAREPGSAGARENSFAPRRGDPRRA